MEIVGGPKIKHRIRFGPDGKPIIDQAGIDAGNFLPNARELAAASQAAALEPAPPASLGSGEGSEAGSAESNAMAIVLRGAAAVEMASRDTCILAPEVKRIYAYDLNVERGVNSRREKWLDEYMNKDMIYRLLTLNREPESSNLLNRYVALARICLTADGIFPGEGMTDVDLRVGEDMYQYILRGTRKEYKRFFIFQALSLSSTFVDEFCPRENVEHRAFLTDPDALTRFLLDPDSPFHEIYMRTLTHQYSVGISISAITTEWMKLRPWTTMHRWASVNPAQPSIAVSRPLLTSSVGGSGSAGGIGAGSPSEPGYLEGGGGSGGGSGGDDNDYE
jgi:uncharacterized membrane protein YgcG